MEWAYVSGDHRHVCIRGPGGVAGHIRLTGELGCNGPGYRFGWRVLFVYMWEIKYRVGFGVWDLGRAWIGYLRSPIDGIE